MDDIELLRGYANDHSEAAFTTLVERYVALVSSAAVRQVRDPHLISLKGTGVADAKGWPKNPSF